MFWFRIVYLWVLCFGAFSLTPSSMAQGARIDSSDPDQEADRDNPAGREKWFMTGRTAPDGTSAAELRWQAYQHKIQLRAARLVAARQAANLGMASAASTSTTLPTPGSWTALGPAPLISDPGTGQNYGFVSGRATSVLIDPADPTGNTAYLGGAYGGLWRTQNGMSGGSGNPGGVTWTPMIDTMGTLAVGAIAVQPCSSSLSNCDHVNALSRVILVGTGEANSSINSYYGLGILRSTDAGANWLLVSGANGGNSFKGLGFSKIAFNTTPGQEATVVASTTSTLGNEDGARAPGQLSGPFVSNDAGATWSAASISDGTFGGAVSPISATSVVYNASAGKFYMAMRFHGFYSSTNGSTWTRLANQPAAAGTGINSSSACPTTPLTTCPFFRGEIAVVPGRNEMYVWYTDGNDGDQGIWRSTDGGAHWTAISDSGITSCGDTGGCGTSQGFYNLELAAVPNGSNTDLYAGAINLYKCTITAASPTCSGSAPNTFLNLTHVYNCLGHAAVHPDQHGLDFMLVGGATEAMYFANDGGIYRAVDGFTGLTSQSCTANQFDNLNGTLGSMTQFVSFSEDPTNPAILLGGTQDNGSPSISSANAGGAWHSVLGGDGGYNEIDPVTPTNWYTSNTSVSIRSCTSGGACLEPAFTSHSAVATNSTVGGDASDFYTPYILDPANRAELFIGTCRIWRGSTSGTGYVAISPYFDVNLAAICPSPSTTVVNFVHTLAAGGPRDVSGFSQVIYAGLDGGGPSSATPRGGSVFVTKDVGAHWANVTPSSNVTASYTIGDIAIDASDSTGNTAYVGIQGFGTPHVFQTKNGGTTWTDFSGTAGTALPDAPVNSLIIDPLAQIVYAGMDVGVFSSSTTTASWSEVGPAPNSGTGGYIPDVPATKLRLFRFGTDKRLRASTFGRGIWEFILSAGTPDYAVSVPTPTLTTFPNQPVAFAGTLTALNGYSSVVFLACAGTKPSICTPATTPVTPTANGAPFSINAENADLASLTFTIHAVGNDTLHTTHDSNVTLNVVDFTIGLPTPGTVTANVPNASNATTIQLTGLGSFSDTVMLGCSGLPVGVTCQFSPSTVQPIASTPASVTLIIDTTSNTPAPASSTITITADDITNTGPTKTQTLTLVTTATPDYAIAVSNSSQTTTVLGSATFNGTLTSANGYNTPVNLSCIAVATSPPAMCTVTATPTTPTPSGAAFTVSASDPGVNTFSFAIHSTDGTISHDFPVMLIVNADFDVPATVTTCTPVTAGGASTCMIPINPDGQATFANTVTYPCPTVGFPNLSTCTFSRPQIAAGSPATTVTLTIQTTAAIAFLQNPRRSDPSSPLFAFWLSLPALGIVSIPTRTSSRKSLAVIGVILMIAALLGFAACGGRGGGGGGGGQPGTNKGTYTFNFNATMNGITHSAPMSLAVN